MCTQHLNYANDSPFSFGSVQMPSCMPEQHVYFNFDILNKELNFGLNILIDIYIPSN